MKIVAGIFAFIVMSFLVFKTMNSSRDVVFCEGKDSAGDTQSVRFVDNDKDQARVRVYRIGADKEELQYEDQAGFVFRSSKDAKASRVSLQLSENEKLQVYRACGAQPVCRFERVKYLSKEQQEEAMKKAEAMRLATFENRKKASQAAIEFSALRTKALDLQQQLSKAKNQQEKQKLNDLYKKAEAEAGNAADRLHSMGSDTLNMHQQTEAVRQSAEQQGTQIQTMNLEPSQVEQWCGQVTRPEMKF